jgi:tetratricopeptide (TPR) repeat protein
MPISPYANCPCGSGKQFKWCCQAYYPQVEKALTLLKQNQHVAAEQAAAQLVEKNPTIPQAWAYQANILISLDKREAADAALQKAFDLDPNFAMGFWVRGLMRLDEGEAVGALLLFRKTAELLEATATALQTQVHARIAELELAFNRPVAALAALERARNFSPQLQELREAVESFFGPDSNFPDVARRAYTFRPGPAASVDSWKQALESASTGKLVDALKAWEKITTSDSRHPAGWFNLGLVRAWLGDNRKAVDDLNRSIELDSNDTRIEEASALTEVLRCGEGMEEDTDHHEYAATFEVRDGAAVGQAFQQWGETGRFVVFESDREKGRMQGMILEDTPDLGLSTPAARMLAYLFVQGSMIRLSTGNREMLSRAVDEFRAKVSVGVGEPTFDTSVAHFNDLTPEIMLFPTREVFEKSDIEQKIRERAREFFEETWARKSLKALQGSTPFDAVGHAVFRKRLPGLIRFLQDCTERITEKDTAPLYDFNRLRRKLDVSTAPPAVGVEVDIDTLSASGLGELKLEELSDARVGEAYRAALRLDAPDLAGKFARNATSRTSITDRYPFFNFLARQAHTEGNLEAIVHLLKEGEDADIATNEGRRAVEYALARGQFLARRGDADGAQAVFKEAIARTPNELRLYSAAAEAMLGRKQGAWALEFAEEGLKQARSQSNRDGEGQLLELVAAARKQGA